jgi:hypothetical protein
MRKSSCVISHVSPVFITFLLVQFLGLNSYAQKKLEGNYNQYTRQFYAKDTGLIIDQFVNGRAAFMIKGQNPFAYKANRVGFIDTGGKIVIKPLYINCSRFNNNIAIVIDTIGQQGLINRYGKIIIPFGPYVIRLCENGLYLLVGFGKGHTISIIDKKGRTVVPFDQYSDYSVSPIQRYGYEGNDAGPTKFYWQAFTLEEDIHFKKYLGVKKGAKWTAINEEGKEVIPDRFDHVGIFNNGIAPVLINKKYGVIDSTGNELVPAIYDGAMLTPYNFVIVKKGLKKGVISLNNRVVVPCIYDEISQIQQNAFLVDTTNRYVLRYGVVDNHGSVLIPLENNQIQRFGTGYLVNRDNQSTAVFDSAGVQKTAYTRGYAFTYPSWDMSDHKGFMVYSELKHDFIHYDKMNGRMYYRNGKWGLLDSAGTEIIPPLYDDVSNIRIKNAFVVQLKDKWGILNDQAKLLLPTEYDEIEPAGGENFFTVKKDGKYGLVNKQLRLLTPVKFDQIEFESFYNSEGRYYEQNIQASVDNKWALIDFNGKERTAFKYDYLGDLRSGLYLVEVNNKFGLLNHAGEEIAPCIYDFIQDHGKGLLVNQGQLWGLLNVHGKIILPVNYTNITPYFFNGAQCYTAYYQGKFGIVDQEGKQILPFLFDFAEQLQSNQKPGLFLVRNNKLYGVADVSGKLIVPLIYDYISIINTVYGTTKKYYQVLLGKKVGVVDEAGKQVIPCNYDNLGNYGDSALVAKKDGLTGVMSWKENVIIPFKYENIYRRGDGFIVRLNGKYGVKSLNGQDISAPVYDYIEGSAQNVFFVESSRKIGMIDMLGKIVIPVEYDSYTICGKGSVQVTKNNLTGLMDLKGNVIYPCKYTYIKCDNGKVVEIY